MVQGDFSHNFATPYRQGNQPGPGRPGLGDISTVSKEICAAGHRLRRMIKDSKGCILGSFLSGFFVLLSLEGDKLVPEK